MGAVVEIEETFGIEFDIDELDVFGWTTAGDVVRAVEEKIHAKK